MLKAPVVNTKKEQVKHAPDKRSIIRHFFTGTNYEGNWSDGLRCMEGLGEYIYPDGTVYHGHFERGLFHGKGTIWLPSPYACTFYGQFSNGKLTAIHDMWFDDGLHVEGEIYGDVLDFSKWTYCTSTDRRFMIEHLKGIPPVGPLTNCSATQPTRHLQDNTYDLESSIFNWESGVIKFRPPPFHRIHIVGCPNYRKWIYNECRHSKSRPISIIPEHCQIILKNNLEAEREIGAYETICNFDQSLLRKQYFHEVCKKFCTKPTRPAEQSDGPEETDVSSLDAAFSDTPSTASATPSSDIMEYIRQNQVTKRYDHGRRQIVTIQCSPSNNQADNK